MRGWLLFVCALAGCDTVFGVDRLYECTPDDDDCDELVDRDDPCPGDPGDISDADRDGVGDACDPNLDLPIDQQLEFESFVTLDSRWMSRGEATWDVRASEMVIGDGMVERAVPLNSQPTVAVALTPTFASEGGFVSVFVSSQASTGIPLECRVEHTATGDDLVMRLLDATGGTLTEIGRAKQLPGAPRDGLRIYGGQLPSFIVRCRARYGDSDGLYVDWDFWTTPVDFDHIGLRASQATAAVKSLAIYTVP